MSDITRSEAIKQLRLLKGDINYGLAFISKTKDKHPALESLDMAIASLETDEAYQLEYERTTKNDLGVDWESYKDVDGNSLDDLILEVLQNNFDCGNTYGYKVADEIIGLLPSVTIRPKGHWIKYDKEYFTADRLTPVIHSIRECSECHTKISDFCGEMKYCPNCGVDMREVET